MIVLEDLVLQGCHLTGILPFCVSSNLSQSDVRVQTELHRHMDHVSIGVRVNVAPQASSKDEHFLKRRDRLHGSPAPVKSSRTITTRSRVGRVQDAAAVNRHVLDSIIQHL